MTEVDQKGLEFIAQEEGVVLHAYKDVVGVWTIGIGHTNLAGTEPKVVPGMTITEKEAYAILSRDVRKFSDRVKKYVGPDLKQHEHNGSTSFDLNTGAINRASWVPQFKAGHKDEARRRILMWNKAGGRTLTGLTNRRRREANVILDGVYPADSKQSRAVSTGIESIKDYQRKLTDLGYSPGAADGIKGAKTEAAIKAFQADNGLFVDGIVGPATRARLEVALENKTAVKVAAGGGGAGAVAGGADGIQQGWGIDIPGWAGGASTVLLWAAAGIVVVAIGYMIWRNRGNIFRQRGAV